MQSALLKELTDFTDLRKKNDDFNSINSKQSAFAAVGEIDVENNEMILKSFRELRQKLKVSQRESQHLRQQMKVLQVEVVQLHDSQNNLMSINHKLKQKGIQLQCVVDEIKKKNILLRDSLSEKAQIQQQLDFMKNNTVKLQMKVDKLQEEKKKLIEISIEDKLTLEENINKLLFKANSDEKYLCQMEDQISKGRETILKLENNLKKIEIKYDEEIFNKQWSKENFQNQKNQSFIKELQAEAKQLRNKVKKEKEKRTQIQKRVLELEEVAGLWNVKAQAYEGEVTVMSKKYKKMQRRMSQAKSTANKMTSQKINWQQRFFKAVFISQELINRVKRQLMGDMVELAKSCEYKINKIKEGKELEVVKPSAGRQAMKRLIQTEKKERKSTEKYLMTNVKNQTESSGKMNLNERGVLTESQMNFRTEQKPKALFDPQPLNLGNEQNQASRQSCNTMEVKIRRERQQMQKKLRERMLFRKIDVCSTPDKSKLRDDYLKLILEK